MNCTYLFRTKYVIIAHRLQLSSAENEISELRPMIPLLQKEASESKAAGTYCRVSMYTFFVVLL